LKKDGRSCFQITPLKNGVYIEGSDFWFGDPDKALNQTVPVRHAPRRARRSRITVRQSRQGIWVGLPGNAGYRVALCRPNGRTVFAAKLDSRRTAFIPLQTKSGMYVLSARSATERMTRLIRVD
jgi:hypothetical protein